MVNLEAPSEPQRKISRQSKWDVGTVQWNPHRAAAHVFAASVSSAAVSRHSSDPNKRMRQMNCGVCLCVASQSNQRVDLYSWQNDSASVHTSLQGHTRVIR